MLKKLCGILLVFPVLLAFALPVYAAEPAQADIAVTIEGGGTALLTPQVNCPVPDNTSVTIADGETGHFTIQLNEPGNYRYTIRAKETSDGKAYTPLYYTADISVMTADDSSLYATTVVTRNDTELKSDSAAFRIDLSSEETIPTKTTTKTQPSQNQPQTGDESHLDYYLLFAMAAAAGLFGLAVLYTINTNKLIRDD